MKVLVVEDERQLSENICLLLRGEGYAVDTAADGQDGLSKAEHCNYDAVILDVMLPTLDGWKVLDRLRETKLTPVLMLTGLREISDRARGLDGDADDYVVKPFNFEELSARLRAVIRRQATKGRNVIEIGDVLVDTGMRVISKGGEAIQFTPREYKLVEYLAMHRGTAVSRTKLCEHLSDENENTASNVLDVHVSNIRKKLGRNFIMTRRGHGYCIE
ncbi:MAG TPA: response regulator transcription factor [Planctomycetota bacterium]|nr:response regulator transcription factor [Planctomycetota bacterium]